MKKLLVLFLCIEATIAFGQTKFDNNERLSLVQDVYHNTTKQNLVSYMKIRGRKVEEFVKGDDYFGDVYVFDPGYYGQIQVEYNLNNTISNVILSYEGVHNNQITELRLREARFTYKIDEFEENGKKYARKIWSERDSKVSFVTFVDKDNNISILGYGIFIE